MEITEEAMRAEFWRVKKEIEAIEARSKPLRDERDRIVQEAEARAKALADEFKGIETGLYDLKMKLGMLARAVKNVGRDPALPQE